MKYKYVCVFCGTETNEEYCAVCNEFDGLVELEEEGEIE